MRLNTRLRVLWERLRAKKTHERAQALNRVGVLGISSTYLDLHLGSGTDSLLAASAISAYFLVTVAILAWTIRSPAENKLRYYMSMVLDNTLLSIGMALEGERGAPFFLLYLWITLGNGFRFGVKALLWSAAISATGFIAVIAVSPFWQSISPVAFGLVLTLIAIPLYSFLADTAVDRDPGRRRGRQYRQEPLPRDRKP